MANITRRASLGGLAGACMSTPAPGALAEGLNTHRAYPPWLLEGASRAPVPLDADVDLGRRQVSLGEWLAGRPAVLALWASWCGPCLREKPAQAMLSRRLVNADARARILALQCYDDVSLEQGRAVLRGLHAEDLPNARASAGAERAFLDVFGRSTTRNRTVMPALLLLDANSEEVGRALGMMFAENRRNYWLDPLTFDFLSQLS